MPNVNEFADWLNDQLRTRDWKQSDLVRRSGVNSGLISQILSGQRRPGVDTCRGIAKAFGLRDIDVLRAAGLATPEPPALDVRERVRRQLDELTEEQLKVVERTARALLAEQLLESLRAEPQKPQTSVNRP